jgi:hypothetical protein
LNNGKSDNVIVDEAFEILRQEGVTKHIGTVRRWIQEGKIKATLRGTNRNSGYDITEKDFDEFIATKLPPERFNDYLLRKQVENNQVDAIKDISKTVLEQVLQEFQEPTYQETIDTIFKNGDGKQFVDAIIKFSVEATTRILEERRNTKTLKQKEGE